jgi:hypothetical protein
MSGINITQGTQNNIQTDLVGTTNYQIVKLDRGAAGASSLFTGTLDALTNLAGGTVGVVAKGTMSAGTVDLMKAGTIDTISQFPPNPWGTTVSTGTTTLGTIKAAVAGSAIFVTDLIISAGSATTVVLGMGGTSTPFIGTLSLAQYGGLSTNFRTPGSVTSGSALVYQQSVGCPLSVTAIGFVR